MSYRGTPYYDMARDAGCAHGAEAEQMAAAIEDEHRRQTEREHQQEAEERAMISSLIDPPKTIQDRLRNMEFVHAGESPLYGEAADEIDRLLRRLGECQGDEEP